MPGSRAAPPANETVVGNVASIRYQAQDSGFAIFTLSSGVVVSGVAPGLHTGAQANVKGHWVEHPKYGRQIKASLVTFETPSDDAGMVKYLSSGVIEGVGPVLAKRIVSHFGAETMTVIRERPFALSVLKGVSEKLAKRIGQCARDNQESERVLTYLLGHGLTAGYAKRVMDALGDDAMAQIEENPYLLITKVKGIGFSKADAVAATKGISANHPERIHAGVVHCLREREKNGHTATTPSELIKTAATLLGLDEGQVEQQLPELSRRDALIFRNDLYQTPRMYHAERRIAANVRRLNASFEGQPGDVSKIVSAAQRSAGIGLSSDQALAVVRVVSAGFAAMVGGAGSGKSTCQKVVIHALKALGLSKFVLVSPTGKAARRLQETTGLKAGTIHRALRFDGETGRFLHNEDDPLDADVVIIDESSMMDTLLFDSLLRAIPDGCRVILVGDDNQLASVKAGAILRDLDASGEVSMAYLRKIHRQAEDSAILHNAQAINDGDGARMKPGLDFWLEETTHPADAVESLIDELVKAGRNPVTDIQVITGLHSGPSGTQALNVRLQAKINPEPLDHLMYGGDRYGVGDKVICTRNDKDLGSNGIFNGQQGVITWIDHTKKRAGVAMDTGESIAIKFSDFQIFALGYALTVHKMQGSEAPVVLPIVDGGQWIMLERTWIYTAVTRAQEMCILVGQTKALNTAIKKTNAVKRVTGLVEHFSVEKALAARQSRISDPSPDEAPDYDVPPDMQDDVGMDDLASYAEMMQLQANREEQQEHDAPGL